jgi:FAD/FMN-containing dehydrogenase
MVSHMPFSPNDLAALASRFGGVIIAPGHADYDAARSIFNAMIDRRPAVIAQCTSNDDVAAAIRFGRDHKLEIAVRGGGHSVAGTSLSEGGLVIDLRRMNAVSVDPVARIATVGGGATMSHLDRGTQPFGLATTGGRVSTTGVGGFTLGGGGGWLDRKFGLACDNLVSVELVTADGDVVRASADENSELFWALHGGGGNFGVVTSLRLRLYPLTNVFGGLLIWPAEDGPRIVRAFRDFIEAAPDDVGGGVVYLTGPEADFVPAEIQGKLAVVTPLVFAGSEAEGRKALAPMLGLGHAGSMIAEMPYADFNSMLDDPPGFRNYWSAEYLRALPDEAVDAFCRRAPDMIVPSPSQHVLFPGGGKVARETADWPVPWRKAPWCLHPFGLWTDAADDERGKAWARNIRADLKPWSTGDVYLNFIGAEGDERVIAGFGRHNYERLQRVKTAYDPDNIFHLNHNIRPALKAAE